MKMIVFSRTLRQSDFPEVTIAAGKEKETVTVLRDKPGEDIWLFGGGLLFRSLLDAGLVDTVEVAVIPVLLGGGIPLLAAPAKRTKLKLTGHKVYGSAIVSLEYSKEHAEKHSKERAKARAKNNPPREIWVHLQSRARQVLARKVSSRHENFGTQPPDRQDRGIANRRSDGPRGGVSRRTPGRKRDFATQRRRNEFASWRYGCGSGSVHGCDATKGLGSPLPVQAPWCFI
jgi:dihydrofolate reductase